jgi:hypothetical protein
MPLPTTKNANVKIPSTAGVLASRIGVDPRGVAAGTDIDNPKVIEAMDTDLDCEITPSKNKELCWSINVIDNLMCREHRPVGDREQRVVDNVLLALRGITRPFLKLLEA